MDSQKLIAFKDDYAEAMYPLIIASISDSVSKNSNVNGRKFLIDISSDLENLILDILKLPIEDLLIKYKLMNEYFSLSMLIYKHKYRIENDCKPLDTIERNEWRRKYIEDIRTQSQFLINIDDAEAQRCVTNTSVLNHVVAKIKNALIKLNKELDSIIGYSIISENKESIEEARMRDKILIRLDTEVCPYCNRNYISKFTKNKKEYSTGDLDHYYPKQYFALLSLNLFNFVPSCQICNSKFKSNIYAEPINPFQKEVNYDELYFSYSIKSNSTLEVFIGESFDFELEIKGSKEYDSHLDLFRIKELYNSHKVTISEVLYKKTAYSDSYINSINNLFDEMKLTPSERDLFLYGIEMDESKFHKRPLSKLIYDLVIRN